MRICRFDDNRIGVVDGDEIADVSAVLEQLPTVRWPYPRGDALIANLPILIPEMKKLLPSAERVKVADVKLRSPVAQPGKIIAAPVNYKLHLEESRADQGIHFGTQVKTIQECGVFLKATSSMIGPADAVVSDRTDRRTDHEIELCFVIGKTARHVSEADALDYIAGFMIGLDMTIRGPEERSYRKSRDTFSVFGPWLVTSDEFGDPSAVDFELKVSGQTRQKANTRDLIFDCRKLIAYASEAYTLEPGDIFMTGTPEGVAPIEPGDIMNCRIDGIGEMNVAVRAA
ncbi:fumarylacetoacetate hydrolase family protein [Rhizobium sullae]|uniref:2-keto-4-pentenoate hydratase/2-oxohepta-3-ene-1,7-dioic acid hydratase in catechol pathway n=1 Tax=Rhizobium sullae TaxID=50338 RepID=A0A4R3PZJ3_RHISU|nr:fumarylacetoacetate hydrolase family protein [Rhizobium sullae]TCU06097.1 2-keto-4-pentenoate hydratase/2-oxohepta-3-ene-1,7-dioic acid hydratase in catechol pathway [Rhizobium sullae]UWU19203.1 fumarylacetoacetate hydrolase family protein [Rhizobium sullae]